MYSTLNALVNVYIDFTTDGQVLFCKYCEVVVSSSKKFQVQQHIQTAKHAMKKEAKTSAKQQTLLPATVSRPGPEHFQFNQDLCRALVSADIPLNKLNNKELVSFLEKYTDQKVPNRLREKVGDNSIWVSLDETTDVDARCVANFVFGILGPEEERDKSYLLNLKVLDKYDRVLLVCTDAAPYMVKCMAGLEILFPKMIHVTCLAHGLHRVAELARAVMPDVNVLISTVKKVFLKARSRKERFRQIAGTVPLPSSPVVTRWGTWIEAALYYADNFETVKCVVESFDPTASVHMKEAQNVLKKDGLQEDLIFMRANLAFGEKGLTLKSSMDVVQEVVDSLSHLEKKDYFEKISQVLAKNKGYSRLKKIILNICDITKQRNNAERQHQENNLPLTRDWVSQQKVRDVVTSSATTLYFHDLQILQNPVGLTSDTPNNGPITIWMTSQGDLPRTVNRDSCCYKVRYQVGVVSQGRLGQQAVWLIDSFTPGTDVGVSTKSEGDQHHHHVTMINCPHKNLQDHDIA
ncbi:hypothetical protein Hamer_G005951 [Homarus americanus]|uniref:DUF659 domain-containing protein n=1 Tax=Homarus americanus TaxID=6706 RepID=A0A8J5JD49_HOMAM|nr:hypothetical protein Hamer_G005951 [Homarus americanus]